MLTGESAGATVPLQGGRVPWLGHPGGVHLTSELDGAGFPHRTRCRSSLGLGVQGGTGGAARKSCLQRAQLIMKVRWPVGMAF